MSEPIVWSGMTSSYHHKWNTTPNPPGTEAGIRKVWFLDAQWSTCPREVEDEVRALWRDWELGNDNYLIKTCIGDLEEQGDGTKAIRQYLREAGIGEEELVIIHWWW